MKYTNLLMFILLLVYFCMTIRDLVRTYISISFCSCLKRFVSVVVGYVKDHLYITLAIFKNDYTDFRYIVAFLVYFYTKMFLVMIFFLNVGRSENVSS